MQIKGLENMTDDQINFELQRGARFVVFEYCISIIILTFKRTSAVCFIKQGESAFGRALLYSLISLLFGWWGIPWGPIYTIGSLITNLRGGKDVTGDFIAAADQDADARESFY